jgi:DNA replication protein DnaC
MKGNLTNHVLEQLTELRLTGVTAALSEILGTSEKSNSSYLQFLNKLLATELSDRKARKLKRNLAGAHFPALKYLDDFVFEKVTGFTERDRETIKDLHWLDNFENYLFFGPPGIGKTHLAISCGMEAINAGYTVCFERITNLFRLLKTAEIQRKSRFRINRILKADLVIFDEIGYTPIERKEANLFFNLISEIFERASIIITSNKCFDDWAEMLGDEIMTTALLDRLLHNAKIFNMYGPSYR